MKIKQTDRQARFYGTTKSEQTDPSPQPSPLRKGRGRQTAAATDEQAYERLAQLSRGEYDRVREAEAKRLGLRKETLDAEVARCRSEVRDDAPGTAGRLGGLAAGPGA